MELVHRTRPSRLLKKTQASARQGKNRGAVPGKSNKRRGASAVYTSVHEHCEPILSSLPAIRGLRDIGTSLYGTQYCAA